MASVDEIETACLQWLRKRHGKLSLQRTLYLVPGFEDETANCWFRGPNTIADVWGPYVFSNWQVAIASVDQGNPTKWKWANVRVIDFDETIQRESFLDFGQTVRDTVRREYPDDQSSMGEYDIACHSMGGLDSFAALLDDIDPGTHVPPEHRIARAYNFVTMDAPYRGIPNVEARTNMAADSKKEQCRAMTPGGPALLLVDRAASSLPSRVVRATCYGVDTATQVEVISGNLYADEVRFAQQRHQSDYRFFQIPGASHSGPQGITQSLITIANFFHTLTTAARLS